MFTKESFDKIFRKIFLDFNFQLPVHWVWIGINGAFLTGKIEPSKDRKELESITLSGKPKKLRFPINCMLVDAKGVAAHVLLKHGGGIEGATRCRVDEPPPAISPKWPTGCGKA